MPSLLIVGGGLFGSLAATHARSRGVETLVFDAGLEGAASPAAAGLFKEAWAGWRLREHYHRALPLLDRLYGLRQVSLTHDDGSQESFLFVPPSAILERTPIREQVTSVGDGVRLASASYDKTVRLWDAIAGDNPRLLRCPENTICGVAFAPAKGEYLIAGGSDGTARVWNVDNAQLVLTVEDHPGPISCVAYAPDGNRGASASGETFQVWDMTTGTVAFSHKHAGTISALAFSPDSRMLAVADRTGAVVFWEIASCKRLADLPGNRGDAAAIAFRPNGKELAVASASTHHVAIWDTTTRTTIRTLEDVGVAVAYSPDGQQLAAAGRNGTIHIWDAEDGKLIANPDGHAEGVTSLAFSPDGKRLASASKATKDDGELEIAIWEPRYAHKLYSLGPKAKAVTGLAFSADGHRLAAACADSVIRVWDATPHKN